MSRDVAVIQQRSRADFGQSREVVSFFIGLFCEEKGPLGFLGALSLSKSPKSKKGSFFEQSIPLKRYHFEGLGKSARAEPSMTVIAGDIVEAPGSNPQKAVKNSVRK